MTASVGRETSGRRSIGSLVRQMSPNSTSEAIRIVTATGRRTEKRAMLIRGPLYRPDPVWLLPDVPVPGCALPIALELPLVPVEVRLDEVPPPDELSGAFRRLLTCGVRNPGGGVRSDESPPVADPPAAPGCRDVPPVT